MSAGAGTTASRTSVEVLKGVGPARLEQLEAFGIRTIDDLLQVRPSKYLRLSDVVPIGQVREGETVAVSGTVVSATITRPRGGRRRGAIADIADETGSLRVTWFGQGYLRKQLTKGRRVTVSGAARLYRKNLNLAAAFYEFDGEGGFTRRVVPVYALPDGFPKRTFSAMMDEAVEKYAASAQETFPEEIRQRRALPATTQLLKMIHCPRTLDQAATARRALAYEELFIFEAAMARRRRTMERARTKPINITEKIDAHIRALFPFDFTPAQDRVITDIAADLARATPMNRLLQGDVGSGKTAVAIYSMLAAVAAGRQAALMAPTEILAEQHYRVLSRALARAPVKIALFTSSMPATERRQAARDLAAGAISIAVGTHALTSGDIAFKDLGVAVVDEQHKFGVLQRRALGTKGRLPHTLVMTATPIPRTLALTIFADLSVSTIDRPPPGRQPIDTRIVGARGRRKLYNVILREVARGRQAYVVYPVIATTEKLSLAGAKDEYEKLRTGPLSEVHVGLLHGGMTGRKKNAVMSAFLSGEIDVLVATTVIEVGMDVPSATVMVIEHAERFGLAQLHQLRGRIGRGTDKATCFLVCCAETSRARIAVLEKTCDGFAIAAQDMKLRGPGEFFGVQQHGLPRFQLADVIEDWQLLLQARDDAFAWVDQKPSDDTAAVIDSKIERLVRGRDDLVHVG